MSRLLQSLKPVDATVVARERIRRMAHDANMPMQWLDLVAGTHCARIRLHGGVESSMAWVRLDRWADAACPGLSGIAWPALSGEDALGLLGPYAERVVLDLGLARAPFIEFVDIHCVEAHRRLPCLSSSLGEVWVDHLDWMEAPPAPARVPRNLPLPVTWELAICRLSPRLLSRLAAGDALLCQHLTCIGRVAGRPIAKFEFKGNAMTIESFEKDAQMLELAEESGEGLVALSSLPVEVSVVLLRHTFELAELAQWHVGSTIPLSLDALKQVTLYANGQRLAMGELVRVDDQLAVQIEQTWVD